MSSIKLKTTTLQLSNATKTVDPSTLYARGSTGLPTFTPNITPNFKNVNLVNLQAQSRIPIYRNVTAERTYAPTVATKIELPKYTPFTQDEVGLLQHQTRLPIALPKSDLTNKAATNTEYALKSNPTAYGFIEGFSPLATKKQLSKQLGQEIDTTGAEDTLGYKIGYGAGLMGQYLSTGGVAHSAVKGALTKAIPSLVQNAGRSTAKNVLGVMGASALADVLTGVPVNTVQAIKESTVGEDVNWNQFAKSFAVNTAIDVVFGGLIEGGIALKSGKKVKTVGDLTNLTKAEADEVTEVITKRFPKRKQLHSKDVNYRGLHTAPINDGFNAPLHDLTKIYPEDVYSSKAANLYGHRIPEDKKAAEIVQKFRNNPEAEVTVYRAVPEGASHKVNRGDWVTLTEAYAKIHGDSNLDENYKIIKNKVKVKDIYTNGDSIHEFGYDGGVAFSGTPKKLKIESTLSTLPKPKSIEPTQAIPQAPKLSAEPLKANDLYLHSTSAQFDNFKPSGDGFVYFSKKEGDNITQAERFFNQNSTRHPKAPKDRLIKANIDNEKIKVFDPSSDAKAKAIVEKYGLPSNHDWVKWDELAGGLSQEIRDNGYSMVKIAEPSGGYSYAVSNMDAIKILQDGKPIPKATQTIPQGSKLPVQPIKDNLGMNVPKEQAFSGKKGFATDIPKVPDTISNKASKLYNRTVDSQNSFARATKGLKQAADKDIKVMGSNARNARGTTEYVFSNNLVDMEGKALNNESLESILNTSKSNQVEYNDYLLHKHNIDRYKQDKAIFLGDGKNPTVTDKMSEKIVADYEKQYPEFIAKSETLNDFNSKMIDQWTVKSGLITEELGTLLKKMYANYVPTIREGGVAGESFKTKGLKANSGIKTAIGGNKPIMDINKSYPIMVQKVIKAARQNELYNALLDTVERYPEKMSKWAKIVEDVKEKTIGNHNLMVEIDDSITANGLDSVGDMANKMLDIDTRNGKYYVTAMKEGKPIRMEVHKDLFDGFEALNKNGGEGVLDGWAAFARRKATNPFKALITGYNPFFALRNIARDVPTSYVQGTENNPAKWFMNLVDATKGAVKKDEAYKEYMALGGKKTGFFNNEKGLTPKSIPTKVLRKVGEKIQGFNELTETIPRYGEYLGTVKREGGDYAAKQKGIYNAGEVTVNFGRSGDITKAFDSFTPYLNPAVQGIDKSLRAMRKPSTWAKGIGIITTPTTALYLLNNSTPENKKNYEQLDNRTKDSYYVIPTGEGGFIKIPKSRESGVMFGSLFERLYRAAEGQSEPFNEWGNTVATNFAPMNPLQSNILTPATKDLWTNKDFANRSIVPGNMTEDGFGDARSKYLQYDETTSEIAKWLGNTAKEIGINNGEGFSPKVIEHLIDSYTGIIGDILLPATTKGENAVEKVLTRPFTADVLYNNNIQNNFYEKYDEAKQVKSDNNINGDIPSEYVTPEDKRLSVYISASLEMSALRKEEKEITANMSKSLAKEQKLRAIRQEILDIAAKAPGEAERVYENYKKTYIPEISMMSENQQEKFKTELKPKGITASQYHDSWTVQKEATTNIGKAILLKKEGYSDLIDAFDISAESAKIADAIYMYGLDGAYTNTHELLSGVSGSEAKLAIVNNANPNLPREKLIILYEAFDISQGTGRYQRQFN